MKLALEAHDPPLGPSAVGEHLHHAVELAGNERVAIPRGFAAALPEARSLSQGKRVEKRIAHQAAMAGPQDVDMARALDGASAGRVLETR